MNVENETETETTSTSGVAVEEPIIKQPTRQDIQAAMAKLLKDNPWFAQPEPEPELACPHVYMFQLNANHTLVRGCIHCGQTCATLVMGSPDDLQWHRIQEPA